MLGSQAAAGLGLTIGDEFVPAHGVAAVWPAMSMRRIHGRGHSATQPHAF
ncbi:MAG: hypothetical protein R2911_09860 [Caldilineaceae bacterium]